ncbi:unnamed protein product [Linum trigynum]|uniref:Uncharacterized protein n=1 Tax=Linum trigynum TaxID=586398 RepID=A0AAV2FR51_9ROSI
MEGKWSAAGRIGVDGDCAGGRRRAAQRGSGEAKVRRRGAKAEGSGRGGWAGGDCGGGGQGGEWRRGDASVEKKMEGFGGRLLCCGRVWGWLCV